MFIAMIVVYAQISMQQFCIMMFFKTKLIFQLKIYSLATNAFNMAMIALLIIVRNCHE